MFLIRACSGYLSTTPVRRKLSLLTAVIAVGVILLSVIAARMQYLDLHATRMSALEKQVEMAQTILARYAALADSGQLTLAQAQAQAIETLAAAQSPSNSGYFTLLGTDQTMVMHPFRRDRAGRPLQDFSDRNGVNQYVEQLAVALAGGGYFTYTSRKSSDSEPLVRQTYAELYKPWGWVITTGTYTEDVQKQALGFTAVMTLAGGLLVLLVLALSWLIGNRIVRPLQRATLVAAAIADGRLDNDTGCDGDDEPARLLHSMGRMQERLKAVIAATRQMAQLHGAGQTSHRIDSQALPGDYGLMSAEINALVADHVDTATMVADLVQRYALGDLSQQAPRLPGEKARLSQAMDTVKANLGAISDEITRLSQAAVEGDFSLRGDQQGYQYGFATMVARLNLLMQTCDSNLQDISQVLQAIARGDLTQRMHGEQQGVFAQMRDDANTTVDNLVGIVSRIQLATGSINAAAGEIANGNQDLSQRTEQQAASLEETAASMEELTSTVRHNAEHARQANQLALGAAQVASSGGEVVGQVIQTMGAIEQSSQRIADILSVIDGIAFQTNILALNAAVEAARAGDQGRGFAVVASEVRTLAQSSAAAARQIKVLIDDSVERVSAGTTLVHKAGHTMQEIVASVDRVTGIMGQISASSQEQSAGIEQVSQTVMQMDQTTQQNAALVQEANAAAQSMEDQARQLADAVAVFRIADADRAGAAATAH